MITMMELGVMLVAGTVFSSWRLSTTIWRFANPQVFYVTKYLALM